MEKPKNPLVIHCPVVSLYDAKIGQTMRVKELCGDPGVCHRLRELGFCEYTEVCKLSHGSALICRTSGSKIVLSKRLAKNIIVEKVESENTNPQDHLVK